MCLPFSLYYVRRVEIPFAIPCLSSNIFAHASHPQKEMPFCERVQPMNCADSIRKRKPDTGQGD